MTEKKKQERFKTDKTEEFGEDEHGKFQFIGLSMVLGGEAKPRKVHLKPSKHIINDSAPTPRGWYKNKHEPERVRPRPCYSEAYLTTPYGGYCNVGCKFCYVDNGTRGYRSTGLPTVNPNYPEQVAKSLSKMYTCGAAYMSSFTEVFQEPLERHYNVVQRLSKVFNDNNLPIFYLSRRVPPDWAVEALQKSPYSYMQWSINTSNESDLRKLTPGALKKSILYEQISKLRKLGIYTSFQVNPILAGITTLEELVTLVHEIASAGGNHVIFKFAEQVAPQRKLLWERLTGAKIEQERIDAFFDDFTQFIGGVYTTREDLRREWLTVLLEETRKARITMSTCYEYYADGGAGQSLAPWFTTADQCHGPSVPVHYRRTLDEPFQPLQGCYRKGCLYCEEHGTKACKSETLIQAKALQYKDFKAIRLDGKDKDWKLKDSAPRPEIVRSGEYTYANPGFKTDAELWNLGEMPPVLPSKGKRYRPDEVLPLFEFMEQETGEKAPETGLQL